MSIKSGNIEFYMGSHQSDHGDDLTRAIVGFIKGAKSTIDIAVQALDNIEIAHAILSVKKRRVQVRIILDEETLWEATPRLNPLSPGGNLELNREIFLSLLRASIRVKTDFDGQTFHQRFIIKDDSALLLCSANFTKIGCQKNFNHVAVIKSKKVANLYQEEFEEMFEGRMGRANKRRESFSSELKVSQVSIRPLFAPDHLPELELMKQILKAKESIHFAAFSLCNSSGIEDALISAARAGVQIYGLFDGQAANQKWAHARNLHKLDCELYLMDRKKHLGKLHHKLWVIDGRLVALGGYKFVAPTIPFNDENLLLMGSLGDEEQTKSGLNRQKELASFVIKEIRHLVETYGEPL